MERNHNNVYVLMLMRDGREVGPLGKLQLLFSS